MGNEASIPYEEKIDLDNVEIVENQEVDDYISKYFKYEPKYMPDTEPNGEYNFNFLKNCKYNPQTAREYGLSYMWDDVEKFTNEKEDYRKEHINRLTKMHKILCDYVYIFTENCINLNSYFRPNLKKYKKNAYIHFNSHTKISNFMFINNFGKFSIVIEYDGNFICFPFNTLFKYVILDITKIKEIKYDFDGENLNIMYSSGSIYSIIKYENQYIYNEPLKYKYIDAWSYPYLDYDYCRIIYSNCEEYLKTNSNITINSFTL